MENFERKLKLTQFLCLILYAGFRVQAGGVKRGTDLETTLNYFGRSTNLLPTIALLSENKQFSAAAVHHVTHPCLRSRRFQALGNITKKDMFEIKNYIKQLLNDLSMFFTSHNPPLSL